MAKQFKSLEQQHLEFIAKQQLFFVSSAAPQGRVNLSPKGLDSLRVIDANTLHWLNLTGSGNETAAHLLEANRMTLMFCSFSAAPLILRLYGNAKTIHHGDPEWAELSAGFPEHDGARQIFVMQIDLVQTSCGYAVPRFDFVEQRDTLDRWTDKKNEEEGVTSYWQKNNVISLDGKDTGIAKINQTADRADTE